VRGVGFLYWAGLAPSLRGSINHAVVHVSDWLPTLVAGVASLPLTRDGFAYGLDGVDQWEALTTVGAAPARGKGQGIFHEIGGDNGIHQESLFDAPYKLVRFKASIYNNNAYVCANFSCPYGWNPLPTSSLSGDPQQPDAVAGGHKFNGTWLFDVFADPLEHHDLSLDPKSAPIVARMVAALAARAARAGNAWDEQLSCPSDPAYKPAAHNHSAYPWQGISKPSCENQPPPHCATPPRPSADNEGSFEGPIIIASRNNCTAHGWCSGAHFSGPPRQARVLLDSTNATKADTIAHGLAPVHRAKAGDHGFVLPFECEAVASGKHAFHAQCQDPKTGEWYELENSPRCTANGLRTACPEA